MKKNLQNIFNEKDLMSGLASHTWLETVLKNLPSKKGRSLTAKKLDFLIESPFDTFLINLRQVMPSKQAGIEVFLTCEQVF